MTERGVYQNPNRGKQLIRFDGIQYGKITPTDFDGVIEYQDRIWVLFEAKLTGKEVPDGQKKALARFVADVGKAGKCAIAMIVDHTTDNPADDIILRNCNVREIITTENLKWRPPRWSITAKEMADAYIIHNMNAM